MNRYSKLMHAYETAVGPKLKAASLASFLSNSKEAAIKRGRSRKRTKQICDTAEACESFDGISSSVTVAGDDGEGCVVLKLTR